MGYELKALKKSSSIESSLGFKTQASGEKTTIAAIFPNSPADKAGLTVQDEIIAVNGMRVENNLNEWCTYFSTEKKIVFTVSTGKRLREVTIMADGNLFYLNYSVAKQNKVSTAQRHNFESWAMPKILSNALV
jgi:predicted metalloprotease with PDZ domain